MSTPETQKPAEEGLEARRSLLNVFVLSPAVLALLVCAVNLVPSPASSYVPLHSGDFRMEMVALNAPSLPPCIAFLGDSRVAFSINATAIGDADCPAANYAFPSLGFSQFAALAKRFFSGAERPETIVLSVSMNALQGNGWYRGKWPISTAKYWQLLTMDHGILRFGWFGFERLRYGLKLALGHPATADGWEWDRELGRWTYVSIATRKFAELESKNSELEAAAKDYTRTLLTPDFEDLAADMVRLLRTYAKQVVILIPPVYPDLEGAVEQLSPGESMRFYRGMAETAKRLNAPIIDCSKASNCGLSEIDFGDSVHLNDEGAERYSMSLRSKLAALGALN
jgi:hypothetical protein